MSAGAAAAATEQSISHSRPSTPDIAEAPARSPRRLPSSASLRSTKCPSGALTGASRCSPARAPRKAGIGENFSRAHLANTAVFGV